MGRRGTLTSALAGILEQDSKLNALKEKREEQRARAVFRRRERQKRRKLDSYYYFTSSSESESDSEYTDSDDEEEADDAPVYSTNNKRKTSFNVPKSKKQKIPNNLSANETAIIFWKTGFELKLKQHIKKQIDKKMRMNQRKGKKSIASKLSLAESKKEGEKDIPNGITAITTTTTTSTATTTTSATTNTTATIATRTERVRKSIPLGENKILFTHSNFKKDKQSPNTNPEPTIVKYEEKSPHPTSDPIIKTLEENRKTNSNDVTKPIHSIH